MVLHNFTRITGHCRRIGNIIWSIRSVTTHSDTAGDLAYSVHRPEKQHSSTPVIILHGFLGCRHNWRFLGKAIAERSGKVVYALDARNHGDSAHKEDMDYYWMADDLKNFMASQNISRSVLIGHSMGGRTVMMLSTKQPERVEKVIVVDMSPCSSTSTSSNLSDYLRVMDESLELVSGEALVQARRKMSKLITPVVNDEGVRQFLLTNLVEKNGTIAWRPNMKVLREKFVSGVGYFPPLTGSYSGKTLFIFGGKSPYYKQNFLANV